MDTWAAFAAFIVAALALTVFVACLDALKYRRTATYVTMALCTVIMCGCAVVFWQATRH